MEPLIELVGDESQNIPETSGPDAVDITDPQRVVLPAEIVEERAHKANLGLGDVSPGADVISGAITRGEETDQRMGDAARLTLKESDNRRSMMLELASTTPVGAPIDQDTSDLINGLRIDPVIDPEVVWEKGYGQYLTNRLIQNSDDPDGPMNASLKEDPQNSFARLDVGRDLIAKKEIIGGRLAELEAQWKEMGWWDTALTIAETVIPGKTNLNISGEKLFSLGAIPAIALAGKTLGEQVAQLHSIPDPETFSKVFKESVDRIAATNVMDAIDFVKAVNEYSVSDQFIRTTFGLVDAADITALSRAIAKGAFKAGAKVAGRSVTKAEAESIKAVTDTIKATSGPQAPETIAAKIGMTADSAVIKAVNKHLNENAANGVVSVPKSIANVIETIPSFVRPGGIVDDAASLPNSLASRISVMLENNAAKFVDTIGNTIQAERLTPEALAQAFKNAETVVKKDFQHLNDAVLDVRREARDAYTNTDAISVRLGKMDGTTFGSSTEAELMARDIYNLAPGSYDIGQQGTAFTIDITKPVTEVGDSVRNAMITTNNQSPLGSAAAAGIQGWKTPAELFSKQQKANRDASLMGNVTFTNFLGEISKPIANLSKGARKDLQRVMTANRDWIDPVTAEKGRYHETIADLEQGYKDVLGRLPTDAEKEAYFTAVQINEMDWALRNLTAYRDLARAGIEDFQVSIGSAGYSEYSAPKSILTGKFKGKEVDGIPWGDNDLLPVAILDESGTGPRIGYRSSPEEFRQEIASLVKDHGYKIVRVARPQERILKETTGITDPVQFIVTKNHTKSPLDFHQVDRKPGFHTEYADPFYLKQPRVSILNGGQRAYEGDAVMWSFQTRAQATKFEGRVNALRQAIKDGVEDLTPYISNKLPENEAWWRRQFGEDGYFNVDQKFSVTARGSSIRDSDMEIKALRDLTDEKTTLTAGMDKKFQGERSQQLLSPVEGTPERPVIRLRPSELIDPLTTTSRGIGQATRSRYFGDMKTSVAEQWSTEFADVLKVDPQELKKHPTYYLHNPIWNENADPVRLAAAKAQQKTTMEFIGQRTPFGKQMENFQDKLMDAAYNATSGKTVEKLRTVQDFVNARDPVAYFRAWAFRAKMGFLNVQQGIVQAQGLAHMTAIMPQHAVQSMAAATFSRAMIFNDSEAIVKGAAQKLKALGWKPEHFEESVALMKRTGWHNVGRESTFIDDMSDPKLYEGAVGKWLDKSAIIFTETERMVRMAGWHAAYREWRTKNPTRVITNQSMGEILSRADTVTLNMTNASKASWERGVFSVPAQFQSYGVRLFEQMWGGQLSLAEKARVIGVNSALYGVPVGAAGIAGINNYEDIKAYALEKGYTVNDTFIEAMMEGTPQLIISMLGGGDLNVGQRLGPGGIPMVQTAREVFAGDKEISEALLGPSGSVFKDIFLGAVPAGMTAMAKMLTGEAYKPELQDMVDALRTITTVNSAERVYLAATIGKYISKNGTHLTDTTTMESIIAAATGLQSREFTDAMIMNKDIKEYTNVKKQASMEAEKYVNRAFMAASQGDEENADAYMKKASALIELSDLTVPEKAALFRNVSGKSGSLAARVRRDWVLKGPASQRFERAKQMESIN